MISSKWVSVLAISVAILAVGVKVQSSFTSRTALQQAETDKVLRWSQSYEALAATEKKWQERILPSSRVRDITDIVKHVSLSTLSWPPVDKIAIASTAKEADLLAHRVCVSDGQIGMTLSAPTMKAAIDGVTYLAKRPDISLDGIKLTAEDGRASVHFDKFCMLFRHSSQASASVENHSNQ